MTKDQTPDTGPDEVERRDYAALVDSLTGTLNLRGGLAEAVDVADYTAMSRHIADFLNLEAGLQSALAALVQAPGRRRTGRGADDLASARREQSPDTAAPASPRVAGYHRETGMPAHPPPSGAAPPTSVNIPNDDGRNTSGSLDPDKLDHVAVGDPDPTADLGTAAQYRTCGFEWVDESSPTLRILSWSCTRQLGHQGQHLAGTGECVAAVHPMQSMERTGAWPSDPVSLRRGRR